LIFPSLDEGFGIPLIEAMNVATPVIASDIPVHREVCGDAAIFITPGKTKTWEKAFNTLKKEDLMNEYIQLGLIQAKKFSWDRSAHQLTDMLKSIYYRT
jgi:glycosyltransferase involved in cell wall biosynthesis